MACSRTSRTSRGSRRSGNARHRRGPKVRPTWSKRTPIAEAAVTHDKIVYAARQYPEAAGTYSGATDLTEYFERAGREWKPVAWTSVPTPAYRKLRARLKESRALHRGRVHGA